MSYDSTPNPPASQPYPANGQSGAAAQNPGKVWGIVGFILSFFPYLSLIGIILSIVGLVKSKRAGQKNGLAIAGIIIGTLVLIGTVIVTIAVVALAGASIDLIEQCQNNPGGSVTFQGQTIDCAEVASQP